MLYIFYLPSKHTNNIPPICYAHNDSKNTCKIKGYLRLIDINHNNFWTPKTTKFQQKNIFFITKISPYNIAICYLIDGISELRK